MSFAPEPPVGERRQLAMLQPAAALAPHLLAARGSGQGSRAQQRHGRDFDLVLIGERTAHGGDDGVRVGIDVASAFELGGKRDAFLAARFDRECGATIGPQSGVGTLRRFLQILRIEVPATDDDQVLQSSGDEQLVSEHEAQVAGAQERTVPVRELCVERGLALAGTLPVSRSDVGAPDPDLTYEPFRACLAGVGVDDPKLLARRCASTTHASPETGIGIATLLRNANVQSARVDRSYHRRARRRSSGDEQRGFRETVDRKEGFAPKSVRLKALGERLQGLGPDRLGAVVGNLPRAQVEGVLGPRLPE